MLATHLVHGRGCVLRGRAGGAQVGAHECVPEEVLLEERAAAALGDVSVRHAEDNAQQPHVVHARQAVVEAHPPVLGGGEAALCHAQRAALLACVVVERVDAPPRVRPRDGRDDAARARDAQQRARRRHGVVLVRVRAQQQVCAVQDEAEREGAGAGDHPRRDGGVRHRVQRDDLLDERRRRNQLAVGVQYRCGHCHFCCSSILLLGRRHPIRVGHARH